MQKVNFKPATTAKGNAKEAEENRLKHYNHRQEMGNLAKVYQLPPDFRYDAAKAFGLLKWYKHKHNGLSYHEDSLWRNEDLVKEFLDELQNIAYRETDFGRKQNIHSGSRTLNCPEQMATTSHPRGGWTSYDYYANFSAFFNRKKPEILFSYDSMVFKINVAETPLPLMKYKHVAECEEIKAAGIEWDGKEMAFTLEDEVYHIREKDIYQTTEGMAILSKRVITALKSRVEDAKKWAFLQNPPEDLEVSVSHSIAAGNCEVGTAQFRRKYGLTEKDSYTVKELKEKGVDFKNAMFQRALWKAAN